MTFDTWLIFSLTALVNIISPGPAILLAISNGVTLGMRAVAIAALGNVLGLLTLSTVSMLGLGLVIQTSATLFTALKLFGAAYLIYLGIKKFRSQETFDLENDTQLSRDKTRAWTKFKEAYFVAVTNPKAILFFVAFFPLFLNTASAAFPQFMIMTFTFMTLSFLSLFTYGLLGKYARRWFNKASVVREFHRITGGIFIGFGVALSQVKS